MTNNTAIFGGGIYKLIAHAQPVGDGYGYFKYRNLYEPLSPKSSAFSERVSVALTESIDSEGSRNLIESEAIRSHSVQGTGLFFDGIEQTGFELYSTTRLNA